MVSAKKMLWNALPVTIMDMAAKFLSTKLVLRQSGWMVTFIVCSTNIGGAVPIVALSTNFYTVPMSAESVK